MRSRCSTASCRRSPWAQRAVVDLRGRFEAGVDTLGAVLAGHPPAAPRRRLRPSLPFAVWIVAVDLLLVAVGLLALAAALAWALLAVHPHRVLAESGQLRLTLAGAGAWWAALTAIACATWWQLLRRRFQPYWLFMWSFFGPGLFGLLVAPAVKRVHDEAWDATHGVSYDAYIAQLFDSPYARVANLVDSMFLIGFSGVMVLFVIYWSAGLFRWSPTGVVDDRQRAAHGVLARSPAAHASHSSPRPVCVHGDGPADEDVVAETAAALETAGHMLSARESADAQLIVVSSDTCRRWLDTLEARLTDTVLCIFATSVRSPADIGALSHNQWVDHRRRRPETLADVAASLAASRPVAPILPERIERLLLPSLVLLVVDWRSRSPGWPWAPG
jgi:hypothetical protein